MSGIAEVLLTLGYSVSGSDTKPSPQPSAFRISRRHDLLKATKLRTSKMRTSSSFLPRLKPTIRKLVRSAQAQNPRHSSRGNARRIDAPQYGIRRRGRARQNTTNFHGRERLTGAHLDPTFVVGGKLNHAGTTARIGKGDICRPKPTKATAAFFITRRRPPSSPPSTANISNQYSSLEEIQSVFVEFVNRIPFTRRPPSSVSTAKRSGHHSQREAPHHTYGTSTQADLVISDISRKASAANFVSPIKAKNLGMSTSSIRPVFTTFETPPLPQGRSAVSNVPSDLIREGLAKFTGVGRRFDIKGVVADVTVIDDYGHHPAEIRATLDAARGCKFNRLLCSLQPHRFTRTQHLWDDSPKPSIRPIFSSSRIFMPPAKIPSQASPAKPSPPPFAKPATKTSTISAPCKAASSFVKESKARGRHPHHRCRKMSAAPAANLWSCLERSIHRPCVLRTPKLRAAIAELERRVSARYRHVRVHLARIGGTTDLLLIKKHESIPRLLRLLDDKSRSAQISGPVARIS